MFLVIHDHLFHLPKSTLLLVVWCLDLVLNYGFALKFFIGFRQNKWVGLKMSYLVMILQVLLISYMSHVYGNS